MVPRVVLLVHGGTLRRWGLIGGAYIIGGMNLKEAAEPWSLPASLFFLDHELRVLLHYNVLPCQSPKAVGPPDLRLEPPKS